MSYNAIQINFIFNNLFQNFSLLRLTWNMENKKNKLLRERTTTENIIILS